MRRRVAGKRFYPNNYNAGGTNNTANTSPTGLGGVVIGNGYRSNYRNKKQQSNYANNSTRSTHSNNTKSITNGSIDMVPRCTEINSNCSTP